MFDLGTQELIVIFIVAFLVFGPKKLPELGRTLGKGIRELKAAMRGVRESFEEAEGDVTEGFKDIKNDLEESVRKSLESEMIDKEREKEEKDKERDDQNVSMTAEEKDQEEKKESDKDG